MSIRSQMISQNNKWRKAIKDLDPELKAALSFYAISLIDAMYKYSNGKNIELRGLKKLLGLIDENTVTFRVTLKNIIDKRMSYAYDSGVDTMILGLEGSVPNILKVGIGTSYVLNNKVVRWDRAIEKFKNSAWWSLKEKALSDINIFPGTGEGLSSRVWDVSRDTQKLMKRIISSGIYQEENPTALARKIQRFLSEPNKLSGAALRDYHPGRGIYRSPYKNALRLARTEEARAYVAGMKAYGMSKDWIQGYTWKTGSGNPCPECVDLEGSFWAKGEGIPMPAHPN